MFTISSNFLDVVLKASIMSVCLSSEKHHKVPLITKQELLRNMGNTISVHWNPYNLSIQLAHLQKQVSNM